MRVAFVSSLALALFACGGDTAPTATDRLRIEARALTLAGVGDVAYTVEVRTAGNALVWREEELLASRYGNGRDLTYIGTCDASLGANPHRVTLVIEDLFDDDEGDPLPAGSWQNPTPVVALADCRENADTLVTFDLTIMRDAGQGFFDVAVTFDEVFCSAKLDCKETPLLFDPVSGERVPTTVLGFACTGGPVGSAGTTPDTHLWLDEVVLTCGGVAVPLEIGGAPGNQYSADDPAPDPLVQVATYYGGEQLSANGQSFGKLYFDVALGIDFGAVTADCTLDATGSASKAAFTTPYTTPINTVWPLVRWHVDLIDAATDAYACGQHALNASTDQEGIGVFTIYTAFETPHRFDYVLTRDPADETRAVFTRRAGDPPEGPRLDLHLFADTGEDGAFDVGEDLALRDVVVVLSGPGGATATFVTGPDGHAAGPVVAGTWTIAVDPDQLELAGYLASTPVLPASIIVAATGTTARAVGFIEAGEVRGRMFIAAVDDLLFDGDEALLAGVVLRFTSGGTTLDAVSDDDGIFRFVALPGTWTLAPAPDQPLLAPYAVPSPSVLTLGPGEFIAFDLALVPL